MSAKDSLRLELTAGPPASRFCGRIAEELRRLPVYRRAQQIFVDPAPCLKQIRLNALMDGRELVMPSPALKEGFYLLQAKTIPFTQRIQAVTPGGLNEFGRKLTLAECRNLQISLLVTSVTAWDESGNRLGGGQGFFDLSFAILTELQAISPDAVVCGVAGQSQKIASVPVDPWDVKMDGVITEDGIDVFANDQIEGTLFWEQLSAKRIRKMSLLWKLSGNITPCSS